MEWHDAREARHDAMTYRPCSPRALTSRSRSEPDREHVNSTPATRGRGLTGRRRLAGRRRAPHCDWSRPRVPRDRAHTHATARPIARPADLREPHCAARRPYVYAYYSSLQFYLRGLGVRACARVLLRSFLFFSLFL